MLWSEIKKWAKEQGYETLKDKGDEKKGDPVQYYWSKLDNPQASGISKSVSKLARDIYNDITNGEWTRHQQEYQDNLQINITPDGY